MAPPRKSLTQARLTGAMAKNPQRYRARKEPLVTEPLGLPPEWLSKPQRAAWRDLDRRLPWLNRSHRCIVNIAAILSAKMAAGTLGVPGMQLLRVTLASMGATPVTAGRVAMPVPKSDRDELLD